MTASAISAYQKHGVNRSVVKFLLTKSFSISSLFRDCFKRYYILYWRAEYFLHRTEGTAGLLTQDGLEYVILYHRTTRGKILHYQRKQVILSFREPQPEFGLPAYVLVSQNNQGA